MPVRVPLSLLSLTIAATIAHAGPIIWDLNDVTFTDGAFGSGYFVYDANTQSILDWAIATSASDFTESFLYTPTTSVAVASSGSCVVDFLADENTSQFLCLNPGSALVEGAAPDLSSSSFESDPHGLRTIASGVLQDPGPGGGDTVPEPATFGLVVLASTVFIGLSRWRLRLFRLT
jgi:hypothetical protein